MMYIQKSSANRTSIKRKIFYILIGFILVGLFSTTLFFSNFSRAITIPIFKSGEFYSDLIYFISLFSKNRADLAQKVLELEQKISDQKFQENELLSLKFENERLRRELNMKPKEAFISGAVIARSPQLPQDTLLINLGLNDGVEVGDMVFASDRSILGKISKVVSESSVVLLNSSSLVSLEGFVSRTGEIIKISGSGGNSMQSEVTLNFDIVVGDVIMYSFISDNVVAVVGAVEEDKIGGSKKILLSLPTNSGQVKTVFVLPTFLKNINE